jgi:hypothetical protein
VYRVFKRSACAALAALALLPAGAAVAAPKRAAAPASALAPVFTPPAPEATPVSDAVVAIAAWAIRSRDHKGLPFAIVDKRAAQVFVFGADGKLRGAAPVLVGVTVGDVSTPYVGDRELSSIPLPERTTPAGRFLTGWGKDTKGKQTLWVDYATAVSIHPLASVGEGEMREERLASPTPDDNRITYGCINVPQGFYDTVVRPTFRKAGVFYVLPETMSLAQAFPGFQAPPGLRLAAQ